MLNVTTLLWVLAIIIILDIIARIYYLSSGKIPQRTPKIIGIDLVISIFLLYWILFNLMRGF